jgi:hypothetical protein
VKQPVFIECGGQVQLAKQRLKEGTRLKGR